MSLASRSPHPRHLPAALASVGLVVVLHGWLLSGLPRAPGPWRGEAGAAPRTVQLRQIVVPPLRLETSELAREPPAPPLPAAKPRAPPPVAGSALPAPDAAVTAAAPSAAAETSAAVPVYPTRLAPPSTLHYALRRGSATGSAVLNWAPAEGRYALSLHARQAAAPQVARVSVGALDAHGIAPDRYTEGSRGREARAANFQRESGRITFSGPQVEHPLPPGAQDRLSWMLQLGAVIAADPALEAPGRQLLLFVAGSRGDAEVWTFAVQGRETVDLPGAGSVPTLLLQRQPQRLHDTLVEVWLDPARHHLPARIRLTVRADTTELVLEQLTQP